jgi:hypothetical protein
MSRHETEVELKLRAAEITAFHKFIKADAADGMCHLLRNGQEQYSFESTEQVCSYNSDQMNQQDPNGNWTYQWNPIA